MHRLRAAALHLSDGTDWSRCDDHEVAAQVDGAVARGRFPGAVGAPPAPLRPLVLPAPVAAPAAAAPAAAPASAAVAPPPAAEATFGADLDLAAMVAVLVQAAQQGVPFCEECARAAAAQAAGEGT